VAAVTGPGYFAALVLGAGAGAWLSGSINTLSSATPEISHSVAGALAGAIGVGLIFLGRSLARKPPAKEG
jgi:hypothetical protein